MKSERNNGYLASTVVTEQSADLPESTSQDSISTPNSLQVTYGSRGGTTTSVLQHPIKPQRPIGVTRVTSITRRRRGTVSRQRLLGVLAITLLATCLFILLLLALNTTRECVREPHPNVCMTEECVQTAASLLAAMDRTVAPCIDFFQYACGTWNRLHVIPEDRSAISTFEILADQLQVILKRVLEEPPNENDNNATLKAKMFYRSCMDIPRIREIGDAPLKKILERLGGWPAVVGTSWRPPTYPLEVLLGRLRGEYNVGVLMEQWVGPDDKNSSANILQLDQMQLALPSRDYYLKKASLPEADRHDTSAMYRKLTLQKLQQEVPQLHWLVYLREFIKAPIDEKELVVMYAMPYFMQMGRIISRTDRRTLHNYILWRFVMSVMPHMIDEYQQKRIEFRKILLGILSERNRWSQCVEWTNKKLGMAVGALFIRENFNHESKETALEMIRTIREAFNELLVENHWMDDETRAVAKKKADSMNERIGYPEFLKNPHELSEEYKMFDKTHLDKGIMDDGDDRSMLEELLQQKLEIEEQVKTLLIRRESQRDRSSLQEASTKRGDEPENRSGVARQSTYWCNAPGTPTTSSHNESTSREEGGKATSATSLEALRLIEEIRTLPPPRLKLTKPTKISAAEVHAENAKRNRIPNRDHPLQMSSTWKRTSRTTDDPKALVAPSVTIAPLPLTKMPSFDEVLKELGVPELLGAASEKTPLYFTDCRIISEGMLKDLVIKRAKLLVERIQSTKVDRGTQTFVTSVGKKYVAGCVNCRSREHHFKNCNLPYRPGFCRICGADGFDTDDCIYPHGIEHELALHRCPGCTTDLSLYCPECPDCNVRYGDIVDWLRLNYATWPTALVPKDHRHLINEGAEVLKRKVKAKFDDPTDHPNRVRAFLIRENALLSAPFVANRTEPTARELSVERNLLAIQAICSPRNEKSLDEIMRERPEMRDGEEIRVVVPTKYKKGM